MGERKGIKTTEFWLSVIAMLVGALLASGLIGEGSIWGQVLGVVSSALAAMGYSVARGLYKRGEAATARAVEARREGLIGDPSKAGS